MRSYIEQELPDLIAANFPADMARQGITGHSMGGHGALTISLRNPGRFRSTRAPALKKAAASSSAPQARARASSEMRTVVRASVMRFQSVC
jgi:S-formylglutathione hydrolase FrmB